MTLSITFLSRDGFIESAKSIGDSSQAEFRLSFDSEREAVLARQALYFDKYEPNLLNTFSEFRRFDPTSCLPTDVRNKAVRLFPRDLQWKELDDVDGMLSSMYDGNKLVGSIVCAAFDTPIAHASRLFHLLKYPPQTGLVRYAASEKRVYVDFGHGFYNFWIDIDPVQMQSMDLQETLDKGLFLAIALPLSVQSYEEFMSGKMAGTMRKVIEFAHEPINRWLLIQVLQQRVVRRSWSLINSKLQPAFSQPSMSAESWLQAA